MIKYKRILLKLSGESLSGNDNYGINTVALQQYAADIKSVTDEGVQVGIVIGGGNIFRGLKGVGKGFDRVKGDQMGMLSTVINSLAIQNALQSIGVKAALLTAVHIESVGERFSKETALRHFSEGTTCIIGGGTGNPFFTTDTASVLRAVEIEADILLKGTRVDGVYTADPEKDTKAKKFDTLSFDEAFLKNLRVMDMAAFALCKENNMPLFVFDMNKPGNLLRVVQGEHIGTLVKQ